MMSTKAKRATSALPLPLMGGARGHIGTAAPGPAALNVNDSAWSVLYGALVQQLGLNPQTFQLIYPMTSWNWPTNNAGYTNAAQYDFCATIPQWSAVGAYVSSGATFDADTNEPAPCPIIGALSNALNPADQIFTL